MKPLLLLLFAFTLRADTIIDFTLVSDPAHSTVTGNVSGEIYLPDSCTTCAADQIVLTSLPNLLNSPQGNTPSAWSVPVANLFTESNGVITSALFFATSSDSPMGSLFCLNTTTTDVPFPVTNTGMHCPSLYAGLSVNGQFVQQTYGVVPGVGQLPPQPDPRTTPELGTGWLLVIFVVLLLGYQAFCWFLDWLDKRSNR